MNNKGSVSRLVSMLRRGDQHAIGQLWDRFYPELVDVVRHRLNRSVAQVVDEDDIASASLLSLFRRTEAGQFAGVCDRGEFWALLLRIAERKLVNRYRYESTLKRGAGKVGNEASFSGSSDGDDLSILASCGRRDLTPDYVVILKDTVFSMLEAAPQEVRQIVIMRLHGYSNDEISLQIDRSVSTVERRLRGIRRHWDRELSQ